jgi:hypothetical protein
MNARTTAADGAKRQQERAMTRIAALDSLIGAHPTALRDIYRQGTPADPSTMAQKFNGRILTLESFGSAYMLGRPLMNLAARWMPWRGKVFESGGTAGVNRLLSGEAFRFHCGGAPSPIDALPTLRIAYDGLGNPWWVERVIDELRMVGEGVGMGPMFVTTASGPKLLLWWGLESSS